MRPATVPVIEINPTNPDDVDMTLVPVGDLDDLLEDIVEDYDLGFGELGSLFGQVANAKLKGSIKISTPKVQPKAILAASKKVAQIKAAVRAGVKLPKTQLKASIKLAPVAYALKGAVRSIAQKPFAKLLVKGKSVLVKPNIKLPSVRAKIIAKAAAKVAGKINKKIDAKAKSKSPKKIIKAVKKRPAVKIQVAKGKFPTVPVNRTAVIKKTAAKHMAGQVAALAPAVRHGKHRAVAAASRGKAKRPAGLSRPVAVCIRAFQSQNIRPCIIAQKKPAGAALSGRAGAIKMQQRAAGAGRPMATRRFKKTLAKLLHAVECKCAASPSNTSDIQARVKRIRRITGVGNAQ